MDKLTKYDALIGELEPYTPSRSCYQSLKEDDSAYQR